MEKKNNYFEAELEFDNSTSEEIKEEIVNVLGAAKFNKLSYPVSTYLHFVLDADSNVENKTKIVNVGYIKKFIKDQNKFILSISNANKEKISNFKNPKIKILFNEYAGKLGIIKKILIVDSVEA